MESKITFDGFGLNRDGERFLTGSRAHVDEAWFKETCTKLAAATDLLEAAKDLADTITNLGLRGMRRDEAIVIRSSVDTIRSAIAKAEGKTP